MATGTGWPFGGPWISGKHGNTRAVLTDGTISGTPELQMVKRAAPGGEGLVANPYSSEAMKTHLAPFDRALEGFPLELIRGQFHDSFEYYNASWVDTLPQVFQRFLTQMCARFSPSRSAAPWEEGADALVPANQR